MAFPGKKEGRTYPVGNALGWSVSTALNIIDKSDALTGWAAKETAKSFRAQVEEIAQAGLDELLRSLGTIEDKAKKARFAVLSEAANIGTRAHKYIEVFSRLVMESSLDEVIARWSPPEGEDARVINAVNLFHEWAQEVDFRPVAVEAEVGCSCEDCSYGGRLDLVAAVTLPYNGEKVRRTYVFDTKTSNGIYDTHIPQVCAYRHGYLQKNPGALVEGCGIIRVGKEDADYQFYEVPQEDYQPNLQIFQAALRLYEAINGKPKPGGRRRK